MWSEGVLSAIDSGNKYKYWVKHFEEGSEFGIGGGRVSKLTIRKVGESRDIVNYDRDWDVEVPEDSEVKSIYDVIIAKYN
jgi:hypothetical protein